jgi:hypothetical protein
MEPCGVPGVLKITQDRGQRMNRKNSRTLESVAAMALGLLLAAGTANAARQCQDDVDELRQDIKQHEDKYKKEAREDALDHLRKAELHRVNPAECYEEVGKARASLASGRKVGDADNGKDNNKDKKDN